EVQVAAGTAVGAAPAVAAGRLAPGVVGGLAAAVAAALVGGVEQAGPVGVEDLDFGDRPGRHVDRLDRDADVRHVVWSPWGGAAPIAAGRPRGGRGRGRQVGARQR